MSSKNSYIILGFLVYFNPHIEGRSKKIRVYATEMSFVRKNQLFWGDRFFWTPLYIYQNFPFRFVITDHADRRVFLLPITRLYYRSSDFHCRSRFYCTIFVLLARKCFARYCTIVFERALRFHYEMRTHTARTVNSRNE